MVRNAEDNTIRGSYRPMRSANIRIRKAELWIRIHWIRIRIQHFNPDPAFDDQKLKKKKYRWNIFWIKNCNLLMSKLQEKTLALKREHPAPQKMKLINFFLCLWVIFALLDPDPDPGTHWIRIHSIAKGPSGPPVFFLLLLEGQPHELNNYPAFLKTRKKDDVKNPILRRICLPVSIL